VNARGFTLVETLVAISMTAIALTSLAQLFIVATRANASARRSTFASILAVQKTEQLRSLDPDLTPTGASSLTVNTPGACDFLDEYGQSLGTGSMPLPDTVYVRRWSIEPLASASDIVIVQVAVFPLPRSGIVNPSVSDARTLGGAQIVTVKTRRAG
jgi:prepilin-type N-terminal cleavage/methylation domain-containing protein